MENKKIVLQLGGPIRWFTDSYEKLRSEYEVIQNDCLSRNSFLDALREKKFGDIFAVFRPSMESGNEMGDWNEELISLLPPSLKLIASAGAGYDWADVKTLGERGILYCNCARAPTESVAEAAIWMIIGVFRQFRWSMEGARACNEDEFLKAHQGVQDTAFNVEGKSLGIIGLGNIGYRIAEKAYKAFDMKIYYHDIIRKSKDLEDKIEANFCETLESMLEVVDCTVIATPFSGTSLIDAELLSKFKHGSKLINIARGKLINEDALYDAIVSGKIGGVGLDVHYNEPQVHKRLANLKNVIMTCHTAGCATETIASFEETTMDNIRLFDKTGKTQTPVNLNYLK
ncbi:hypothetical protein V1511DRAFT_201413 [Dipodascopsis uninucleata]